MTKENKSLSNVVIKELFYFLSLFILIFSIAELIFPNFIIAYFNLNYVIVLWLTVGLIDLFRK
jgi:hypothetical protein